MKKILSLLICLLLVISVCLPVLATESTWEAEPDMEETYSEADSNQVYIQWVTGDEVEYYDGVAATPVDPNKYQIITSTPEEWVVDGEEVVVYGSVLPPESTRASSSMPAWILLILLVLGIVLVVGALVAVIVFLVILLIVKAARKKKDSVPEAADESQNANE